MGTESFRTRVLRHPDAEWERAVAEMDSQGIPVPLPVRAEWARHLRGLRTWLVTAEDASGRCRAAVALEVAPTRALPGHLLARGHHLGCALVSDAGDAVLARVRELAQSEPRLLRLSIEFLLRRSEDQARVSTTLEGLGFARVTAPRNYRSTLVITLDRSEREILAGFSTTTRRNLRHWSEQPLELRPISDPRYADRLNAIAKETYARTGGRRASQDWIERMALCERLPARSRLVGLFRAGQDDPAALLAYAWGCAHGDYAHYDDAGSTRVDDIKASMAYPLMWDLIQWARRGGCRWFDMGGARLTTDTRPDARAGIAEFKRRFSKVEATVGVEWAFEPSPRRARFADALRRWSTVLRPSH